jgi:hypothetical protein
LEDELSLSTPLTFYFGDITPYNNISYYKKIQDRLAECVRYKLGKDTELANNGVIVNTYGWKEGGKEVQNMIQSMEIDHVLVLGDDRLTSILKKTFANKNISIERINKNGGVVPRK